MMLVEVKRAQRRNSLRRLEQRSEQLLRQYHEYEVNYVRFSLDDAKQFLA